MITYKNIIEIFQNIATNHYEINSFHTGTLDEVDINKLNKKDYPILYVEPSTTNVDRGVLTYTFNVYTMSLIDDDITDKQTDQTDGVTEVTTETNRQQVWSTMLQVMQDIIAEYRQNLSIQTSSVRYGEVADPGKKFSFVPNEIVLNMPVSVEPFTVRFANMLTGWTSTFSIQVNNPNSLCDAPIELSNDLPNT
ncbi:MAG: hypothetical protein Unbinned6004contig1002_8 [Prokaryotic dsDNA virus sp.]|nr:MAG: hypothetical protein Unbinned6004contig1002_8 [Prokaryotic dsDNA virus sp.]|tara:strand:- start:10030 stop:10611 length:582 start_codon:yes stop_codon:yes gene_type:complete